MKRRVFVAKFTAMLIGLFAAIPSYGSKKKKPEVKENVAEDADRDGVVEAYVYLDEYKNVYTTHFIHICCGCGLTHNATVKFFRSKMLGLPVLYMKWVVDEERTNRERVKKFGPGYWSPSNGPSIFDRDPLGKDPRWND